MKKKVNYKTIVISDVHLGTKSSKAKELLHFLRFNSCSKLVLNGDIIDGWRIQRSGRWDKHHTSVLKHLIKMVEKHKTQIIYIKRILPL